MESFPRVHSVAIIVLPLRQYCQSPARDIGVSCQGALAQAHVILLPGLHGTDELWGPLLMAMPAEVGRTVVSYPIDQELSREQLLSLIEQAVPASGPLLVITDGVCDRLQIRREHAFLLPRGRALPFVAKGPVFRIA